MAVKAITQRVQNLIKKYQDQTLRMILDGATEQKILFTLVDIASKDKCTLDDARVIYKIARKQLSQEYDRDREFVIANHINRYNKEIKRLFNIDVSEFNKWKAAEMKTYAYFNLLEVLQQKEKVLGLHSKRLHIKINNEINLKTKKETPTLNLSALTLQEKIELYHLLQESEIDQENMSIIPSTKHKVNKEEIEDAEYVEELPNIDSIKAKEISPTKEVDNPNTLLTLQEKLAQANLKAFEKKIKEAKIKK